MLKKIYAELVAIKKELQNISRCLEPKTITVTPNISDECIYTVSEETFFIDREADLTQVSFSLPYRDWCELQKLKCWNQVSEFLNQRRKFDIQKSHKGD